MARLSWAATTMPARAGVAGDELRERHLERVLVVEHVQLVHAQRAHQPHLRTAACAGSPGCRRPNVRRPLG